MGTKKSKILVADNSVAIQKIVNLAFAGLPYDIVTASDGDDALLKAKSFQPDYIMADSNLRGIDGLSLCERIRKDSKIARARFILLRAGDDTESESRERRIRPDAVLVKPFDTKALAQTLESLREEESTVVRASPEMSQKLESIAAQVVADNLIGESAQENTQSTVTLQFNSELSTVTKAMGHSTKAPSLASQVSVSDTDEINRIAEVEIRAWVEKNLSSLAERLIKEEILKLSQ